MGERAVVRTTAVMPERPMTELEWLTNCPWSTTYHRATTEEVAAADIYVGANTHYWTDGQGSWRGFDRRGRNVLAVWHPGRLR